MDSILGPASELCSQSQSEQILTSADIEEAYANYITDGVITLDDNLTTNSVKSFLKVCNPIEKSHQKIGPNALLLVTCHLTLNLQKVTI